MSNPECPLCSDDGGDVVFEDAVCRIVLVRGAEGAGFPGFCRVVWKRHVREMSDLAAGEQRHLLDVVLATERVVRALAHPDKMNLASLGNVVPHLHWHIIPRWRDDSHFPDPIWAEARRPGISRPAADTAAFRKALQAIAGVGALLKPE